MSGAFTNSDESNNHEDVDYSDTSAKRATAYGRIKRRTAIESSLTFVVFIVLFAIYAVWLGDKFLHVDARMLDVHQSVSVILLGLAALVTLTGGLFDLSIASVASLSVYLTVGLTIRDGWPFPLVLLVVLGVGVVVGLVNGFLVETLGVNTFIATLGTGSVVLGLSSVYSGGSVISTGDDDLPGWFHSFGQFGQKPPLWVVILALLVLLAAGFVALGRLQPKSISYRAWSGVRLSIALIVGLALLTAGRSVLDGLPWTVLVMLIAAGVVWLLMDRTTFGRNLRAVGSNREAARLAGVPVSREIIKGFVLGGVLSALAGVVLAANQGSASPSAAGAFLLPAFAAAFLSTVVFSTGRFTVLGTVIGGTFVVWTSIGLVIGGVSQTWTNVINGIVLIVAVALSTYARRQA